MIRGMTAPSFMDLALKTAENAGRSGEVPIGCVIVRDFEVIATAGNRTLTGHRHRAAGRLRSLRDTRALHDVRGRDLVRADQAALLWRC
jgi:tRNA(adenine34) deaminase